MFDGDVVAVETVSRIIRECGCGDFIETGTFRGDTTLGMYHAFPQLDIWTIEVDPVLHRKAKERFDPCAGDRIHSFLGDSVSVLRDQIIRKVGPRPFFFLDAHVSSVDTVHSPPLPECMPIGGELSVIAEIKELRPIIMIHDFVSPGHPEFTFEGFRGFPLDWNYVYGQLLKIYPEPITHFYNTKATGNKVGIIYVGVSG